MSSKKFFSKLTILILIFSTAKAQEIIDNSLLLQLDQKANARDIMYKIKRNNDISGRIIIHRICKTPVNVWKFEFDKRNKNLRGIIGFLSGVDGVERAQFNHKIDLRAIPDDPKFKKQWSLNNTGQTGGTQNADIDADLAWEKTTGGVTKNGDTIVICILDTGVDSHHEDLIDNLWVNRNEIENNGIDDDNNGYIDDYRGWNPLLETDDIDGQSHGVSVAGIIGAKGNNGKGISGINWDVKLLIIPISGDEANLIAAYSYVYTMRKLYNDTDGAKGALIVATNNSFGLDNGKAEDFPIWCSMYDFMGQVGVISVGATTNSNKDVELRGDMPSTCPSDFLITVTNMDKNNLKYHSCGYGKKSIDLGAYGENTYSIKPNNGYGAFGGTSAATPHVTGVLGLIYSGGDKIGDYVKSHPFQTALMAKDAILKGVVHNESLENITVTEGVLNANNSLIELSKYDDNCAPPALIKIDTIGGDIFKITWDDYDPESNYTLKYKTENGEWTEVKNIDSPYVLTGLNYCTDYYFALKKDCDDGKYGYTVHVKTDGCCVAPKLLSSELIGSKLHLEWGNILAAKEYNVYSKFWSNPIWNVVKTTDNFIDMDIESDCGKYALVLRSVCEDSLSNSSSVFLYGDECIDCKKNVYCYNEINNHDEWIERFSIDGFSNTSGSDIGGKGIFTDSKAIKLLSGQKYSVKMDIGYRSVFYNDSIYLWIDMNSDSVFSADELLVTDATQQKEHVDFGFTMPEIDKVGETNLRVLLISNKKEDPCDLQDNDYGEYEDYCVFLDTIAGCAVSKIKLDTVDVGGRFVKLKWNNPDNLPHFYINLKRENDVLSKGVEKFVEDTSCVFTALDTCSEYTVNFAPYCSDIERYFIDGIDFKTDCNVSVKDYLFDNIKIYPNPVRDIIFIENLDASVITRLEILDLYGRVVFSKKIRGQISSTLNMENIGLPGIYLLKLKQGNKYFSYKIVKL